MTAVTNTTATTPTTSASTPTNAADVASLDQNYSQFLTLLTTQLQNQDPLSPMDSSQFTNQLVMFSGVEQQLKSNDTLNKLLTMQTLNMTALGVSFIGKDVQVAGSNFDTAGGQNVGLSYTLPTAASSGTVSITDASGDVVYTSPTALTTGSHDFTWNGKDSSGNAVPAGTYTLTVSAEDSTGAPINVTGFVPGHVTSLETADDGTLMLNVGNQLVPMTDVRQISEPTT